MTPLESARAKVAAGNFDLTPGEMKALAVSSAEQNPVMVPVKRDPEVDRIAAKIDAIPGEIPADHRMKSKMVPELVEQILDVTIGKDRSEARAALARLFETRHLSVAIDQTWNSEDPYGKIRTGY